MATITRRRFVQSGLAAGVVLGCPGAVGTSPARTATAGQLAKYLEPVPRPGAGPETKTFSSVVRLAFQQRRKQLRNAWSALGNDRGVPLAEIAARAGIDLSARGESLSVADFTRMAEELDK